MSITGKIGNLPQPIKQKVVDFLKSTNPPFEVTDDLVITVIKKTNKCTETNVDFYRIEVNGLKCGCDYEVKSWNFFDVLVYCWTTEPSYRYEGDINKPAHRNERIELG